MNHDALFKMLLKNRSILRAFFEQFLPEVARFIDFGKLEYVDKERLTLEGKKRTGDLLIKTSFRGKAACFLIHLEHQAQRRPDLAWRMLEYFVLDRREYGLPVYPVAVLSHAEPAGERFVPLLSVFPNKRVLEFDFDVIDLARFNARDFVRCHNPAALALSARMKFESKERIDLAREFYVSLADTAAGGKEKELVRGFFATYQQFSKEEGLKLNEELSKVESMRITKAMQRADPFFQVGFLKGREKGRRQGEVRLVRLVTRLLERRLGALPASQKKAIQRLDLLKIEALGESLLEFESRADLARWLKKNVS